MILGFLDELEKVNRSVQKMKAYSREDNQLKKLEGIAHHLVEADPHHQREEKALFPELEKRGVVGPPEVMRMEHVELRAKKKELLKLAKAAAKTEFAAFKKKLDEIANFIVPTLRDHISKENEILYPMALQVIKEDETWKMMKMKCDRIGYCCFTPKS